MNSFFKVDFNNYYTIVITIISVTFINTHLAYTSTYSSPKQLNAYYISINQIRLSWAVDSVKENIQGYKVYRDGIMIGMTKEHMYTDKDINRSKKSIYEVFSYDANGNISPYSYKITIIWGNKTNYLSLIKKLVPGDILCLEPGVYENSSTVPGLPIFNLHGKKEQPIIITGPINKKPLFLGKVNYNTVRFDNASHIEIRNIEIDGQNLGGDGVMLKTLLITFY